MNNNFSNIVSSLNNCILNVTMLDGSERQIIFKNIIEVEGKQSTISIENILSIYVSYNEIKINMNVDNKDYLEIK